jgi:hypothetical protein
VGCIYAVVWDRAGVERTPRALRALPPCTVSDQKTRPCPLNIDAHGEHAWQHAARHFGGYVGSSSAVSWRPGGFCLDIIGRACLLDTKCAVYKFCSITCILV